MAKQPRPAPNRHPLRRPDAHLDRFGGLPAPRGKRDSPFRRTNYRRAHECFETRALAAAIPVSQWWHERQNRGGSAHVLLPDREDQLPPGVSGLAQLVRTSDLGQW